MMPRWVYLSLSAARGNGFHFVSWSGVERVRDSEMLLDGLAGGAADCSAADCRRARETDGGETWAAFLPLTLLEPSWLSG